MLPYREERIDFEVPTTLHVSSIRCYDLSKIVNFNY